MLTIVTRDFGLLWRPLAEQSPRHNSLAILAGALLFATAAALFINRTAQVASLMLAAFLLLRELVLQLPGVINHPLVEASWYSASENLISLPARGRFSRSCRWQGSVMCAPDKFSLLCALPRSGLSHFFYLDQTAPLIPPWLPFHVPLAYLTGAAHIAAGAAILFDVLPRLAATLEAVMVNIHRLGTDGEFPPHEPLRLVRNLRLHRDRGSRLGGGRMVSRQIVELYALNVATLSGVNTNYRPLVNSFDKLTF